MAYSTAEAYAEKLDHLRQALPSEAAERIRAGAGAQKMREDLRYRRR